MNTKEIQEKIKEIKQTIAPLSEEVAEALKGHNPERYGEIPIFMAPVIYAPLFEDLHQLYADLRGKQSEIFRTHSEAVADLKRLDSAIDKGLIYIDLMTLEEDISLDELRAIAEDNLEQMQRLLKESDIIRNDLNKIAWDIYFNSLDPETLLSDAKSIASSFTIEREDLGESESVSEKGIIQEERKSLTLIGDFQTEHIEGHPRYLLPSAFTTLKEEKKRDTLSPIIMAYFNTYIESLENLGLSMERSRVEGIATRLLDRLSDSKNIQTIRPDTFYSDNTKLAKSFTKLSTEKEEQNIKIGELEGEPVLIKVALSSEDGTPYNPTATDNEIFDVAMTFWETFREYEMLEGETAVVPLESMYQFYLKNLDTRATARTLETFESDLLKLNNVINLNATAGSVLYPELATFDQKGSIVNISISSRRVNGVYIERVVHITALDQSPRYNYAKATKQITATPMKYLISKSEGKKGKTKSRTADNVNIERYLRQRIETLQSQGYEILTEKIFKNAEIDLSQYKNPKDKRAKTISKIKDALNKFKDNGYLASNGVSDWHFEKAGRDPYYKVVLERGKKNRGL